MMNGSKPLSSPCFSRPHNVVTWACGQFKHQHIHQGGALSGRWICSRKLTPASAIKVAVTGTSLSRVAMLRDESCCEKLMARVRITGDRCREMSSRNVAYMRTCRNIT